MNAAIQAVETALGVARDNVTALRANREPWPGYAAELARTVTELEAGLAALRQAPEQSARCPARSAAPGEEPAPSEKEDLRFEKPGEGEGWK